MLSLMKKKLPSSTWNDVNYKIPLAPPHHPTVKPILAEVVTLAKAVTLPIMPIFLPTFQSVCFVHKLFCFFFP